MCILLANPPCRDSTIMRTATYYLCSIKTKQKEFMFDTKIFQHCKGLNRAFVSKWRCLMQVYKLKATNDSSIYMEYKINLVFSLAKLVQGGTQN